MGPLAILAAVLVLGGCAAARQSETPAEPPSPPPPPPPPPAPDCSDSYSANFGDRGFFPCPRRMEWKQLALFAAPTGGGEKSQDPSKYLASIREYAESQGIAPEDILALAAKMRPSGSALSLNPQEKTQALAIATTLLAAEKQKPGFFINKYRDMLAAISEKIQEKGLEIRLLNSQAKNLVSYSITENVLNCSSSLPDSFTSETREEILGGLFDYYNDAQKTSESRANYAFLSCTMQALYRLESQGQDLATMAPEQIDAWIEQDLKRQNNGELKAIALRAFYYSVKDVSQRFEQMKPFPARYEALALGEYFKQHYDQAGKESSYHQSWDEILDEKRKTKPLNPKKVRADLLKMESARKKLLAEFKREFEEAKNLHEAEDKKAKVLWRTKTAEEEKADGEVRKRLEALVKAWSAEIYLRNLQQSLQYSLKEVQTSQPEDALIATLTPFGVLSETPIAFDGIK